MKKLVNNPQNVVREMLEGFADINPDIALLQGYSVVTRNDQPPSEDRLVAVISGGGAGHEPAHAGFVGSGMLQAAVVGDVFTSPSADAVLAAILAVAGPRGALLVVKNYTGDRLNFGLAAELARARGIPVGIVVVADDVALRETVAPERRRGIAGVVLIHKIAGALADQGASLEAVTAAASKAASDVGTMGVALGACTVPAAGKPGFILADDEVELGLGIHGEPGVRRAPIEPADRLVDRLVTSILEDRDIGAGDRVVLLVNNLGGTPLGELSIVTRRAVQALREAQVTVERVWSGVLLSALEMPGCSLSVLPVDQARLAALDAPTSAPAWPRGGRIPAKRLTVAASAAIAAQDVRSADSYGARVYAGALLCAEALASAETLLTDLDSAAGDGDLGLSMARGAAAIRALADQLPLDAAGNLGKIADALRRAIAGSSGPFYAIGLVRAARRLAASDTVDAAAWAEAFADGVCGVAELGGAKPGDRTMLDALHPAALTFKAVLAEGRAPLDAWIAAAAAAAVGAQATASMAPRLGRASYLGNRVRGVEDGGAVAVSIWMRALIPALTSVSCNGEAGAGKVFLTAPLGDRRKSSLWGGAGYAWCAAAARWAGA